MTQTKEVYSKRYGTNPKEGIQKYLTSQIKGYKRTDVMIYVNAFFTAFGAPKNRSNWGKSVNDRFEKFKLFIQSIKDKP